MAVRTSIFDIQIRDDSFNAFLKKYNQYQASLKSMPAAWAAVNKKIDGTRSSFDKIVDNMVASNVQASLMAKAQERADRLSQTTAERWAAMARNTKTVAANIAGATASLLRWGALTGLVSGLLGAGGLFGIDRMALGVAAGRRASLGLGTGGGERRAFGANFGRLVDPDSFLSSVAGAKLDVTKRVGLIGAGLSNQEMEGSAADTAVALIRHLKQIADSTSPALYGQVIGARRLDQFVGPEDLQRLRNTSQTEIGELIAKYSSNRAAFALPPDVARKWQEFTTQMDRAGQGIQNTFVRGLSPLATGLTHLSESFEKVVRAFLSSPTLEKWIGQVDKGLEKFAAYIGTDEFSTKVGNFVTGIGQLASAVGSAVTWIVGKLPADAAAGGVLGEKEGHSTWNSIVRGSRGLRDQRAAGATLLGQLGGAFGDSALLSIVRRSEASGDSAVSRAGAIGRYQIMPGTARQYGFDPARLTDPAYNETAAKAILADLVRRYHGNTAEVLAAYNAGPGRADRFRAAGDNPAVLPRETQQYIDRAQHMQGYSPTVVTIENNTGGNVNTSINGMKD